MNKRFGKIIYEKKDGVVIATLDYPERHNCLHEEITSGLEQAFREVEQDDEVQVMIITGAGEKAFCAGFDLNRVKKMPADMGAARKYFSQDIHILTKPEQMEKPVIAAVNGLALGGGCELALACDMIIASEKATFGGPEIKVGLLPGFLIIRLHQVVGMAKAKEMIMTGDPISAQEALRIGLINKVVPHDQLMSSCMELAGKLMSVAPLALRVYKASVNRFLGGEEYKHSLEVMLYLMATEDQKEGVSAFLEKRKPVFRGR
jgi:enoyl-CoA hydratase